MKFSDLPEAVTVLWAKSDEAKGHSLIAHMLDVAAVAEALLMREPASLRSWIAECFEVQVEHAVRLVATLAGLHDIGKASPGFQAKWQPGQALLAELGFDFPAGAEPNHGVMTQLFLKADLAAVMSHGLVESIREALGAHHGIFISPNAMANTLPRCGVMWLDTQALLFEAYWGALGPVRPGRGRRLPFPVAAWLAGLVSTADWIGSGETFCPDAGTPARGQRAETLEGHFERALALANVELDSRVGWPAWSPMLRGGSDIHTLVTAMVGRAGIQARPLQQVAWNLLQESSGPVLLLVEAPMGEGKTEMAFLAYLRLQLKVAHRGLYIALPTQATGNAMLTRCIRFLRALGRGERLDIQLAHGGAMANKELLRLRQVHGSEDDSVASSAWFSQRRRPLLSPYGVGTVDQALFSILNVKHHFVRLFGLGHKVVILDEVHAYDVYTSGLICVLVRWLKALGASVVLMSATLPRPRRDELLAAWGASAAEKVQSLHYPRVLVAEGAEVHGSTFEARPQADILLKHLPETVEHLAKKAAQLVAGGGCGAVVVNTVQRAQEIYSLLKNDPSVDAEVLLFHARFPANERSGREKEVLRRYAVGGERPRASLLIATQVVEQSLDVDFDFMISDLAPIDLLLQRAGRLHRHVLARLTAHIVPVLYVAGLDPAVLPDLSGTAWEFVYEEEILLRTWAILSREERVRLPGDIDRLVQAVYGGYGLPLDLPGDTLERMESARRKSEQARARHEQLARDNAVRDKADQPYTSRGAYRTFRNSDDEDSAPDFMTALTRLGARSVCAVPVHVDERGAWRLHPSADPFDPALPPDDRLAWRIWNRQVRIGRFEVCAGLRSNRPAGWSKHPLLRGLCALELRGGTAVFGKTTVTLSKKLGIVYSKKEEQ